MTLRTKLGIIISVSFFHADLHSQDWQISTVATGAKPSLDLDSQGLPHVAYVYEATSGWVRYAVWNSSTSSFDTSTVNSGSFEGPPSIGVDANDIPNLNYHRHTPPPEQLFAYPSGSSWVNEAITDANHDGWDNSIAFDSNNLPRTSSIDPSNYAGSTGVEYAYYDGASWHVEQIGSALIDFHGGTSLAIDGSDNPHITYYDDITDDLMYAAKQGATWSISAIETSGDAGRFSSLELNAQDQPRVSYYKHLSGDMGVVQFAEWNGSSWDVETVDTLTRVSLNTARTTTSLELDSQGEPHISYGDEKVVKYATRNGSAWQLETVVDLSLVSTNLGQVTSLALGSDDQPQIVYYEAVGIGIVKYATKLATSVDGEGVPPTQFALLQNYPNPGNPTTTISFVVPVGTRHAVSLQVFDLLGHEIATLVNEELAPGIYTKEWDATGHASGVYFYRISTAGFVETKKLVLLR